MEITKLLALSLFLFALTTISSVMEAGADDTDKSAPVVDIFRNKVSANVSYYIFAHLSVDDSTLEVTKDSDLPHRVMLSRINRSQKVAFSPVDSQSDHYIHAETNLQLKFDDEIKWMAYKDDGYEQWMVKVANDPTYDWFKLVKHVPDVTDTLYEIWYCPKPQPFCDCKCKPVDLHFDGSWSYLAIKNETVQPFPVTFGKVPVSSV